LKHIDLARGHFLDLRPRFALSPAVLVGDLIRFRCALRCARLTSRSRIVSWSATACWTVVVQIGLHACRLSRPPKRFRRSSSDSISPKGLFELRDWWPSIPYWRESSLLLARAREDLHVPTMPSIPGGSERRVAPSPAFRRRSRAAEVVLPESGAGLTFRSTCHDDGRPCLILGRRCGHTRFVQFRRGWTRLKFWKSRVTSSGRDSVAGFEFELLRCEPGVVTHSSPLSETGSRLSQVVPTPRHECDQTRFASERQLAEVGARTVGNKHALHNPLAFFTIGCLVDCRCSGRALNLVSW